MNFTREPIIETVITPKDGYKLTIRNSKGGSQEEYSVDAIEIVSFGQSMFFRSQERPKTFLLPVTDYEVVEVKETRVVLKKKIDLVEENLHRAEEESMSSMSQELQLKQRLQKTQILLQCKILKRN